MSTFASKLKTFATSPAAFRDALLVDTDAGPLPLGETMDDWQRRDFEAMDAAWLAVTGRGDPAVRQRAYLERPRGHSKTLDLAVSVLWALAFSPRQLSGAAAAADRAQARLLRNSIDKLVRLNPWLSATLDIQHSIVKNTRTGSELVTLSSDAPTSYGLNPDYICIDELTVWESRELWDSLVSASAKRRHCVMVCITNAGYGESWQRAAYDLIRQDPGWYFSRQEGPVASWIDPVRLEEQRRLLPDPAYRRLWLNLWSSGSGDALQGDDIEAAVTLPGPSDAERGYVYVGGLDLGISRDHSALAVVGRHVGWTEHVAPPEKTRSQLNAALVDLGFVTAPAEPEAQADSIHHPGTHRLKLAWMQSWRPPRRGKVDLQAVEDACLEAQYRYGLAGILYDPHQAEHLAQRLRRRGVRMKEIPFTGGHLQEMASGLIESFSGRQIDLYGADSLLAELKNLRIIEKSYGFRLDSQRNADGHGDRATALALAVLGCRRHVIHPTLTRPLLHDGLSNPEPETRRRYSTFNPFED